MYKVILIDDEPLARQLLSALIKPYNEINVITECCDGFEGFKAIQQHNPDLVFLDVQMPRVNGFEMLELLDQAPSVIFTTAFDEYAFRAFEAHAIDYLLKPVTKDRFDKAIRKWLLQAGSGNQQELKPVLEDNVFSGYQHRIVVKDQGMIRILPAQDIYYIEANDDYVNIFTREGRFMKKSTLASIERSLDPVQFVRVHRSYLIPVSQLQRIEPYEKESHVALLHCGARVTVSKTGMNKLKDLLGW